MDHSAEHEDNVGLTDRVIVELIGQNGKYHVEIQSTDPSDPKVAASLSESGAKQVEVSGTVMAKAIAEIRTAAMLVAYLRRQGEPWEHIRLKRDDEPEAGVDCFAIDPEGKELRIQVTKAERQAWRDLHVAGRHTRTSEHDSAVSELRSGVLSKKHKVGHDTVLAVDAIDSPLYAAPALVESFRRDHGKEVAAIGFQQIWVVGPTIDRVQRLDE
jgi:hypothetical protein